MSFDIDKQTIQDLELFNSKYSTSVFDIFNHVKTFNGRLRLKEMMKTPSSDRVLLERRQESIKYFLSHKLDLTITNVQFDFIDHYLRSKSFVLKDNFIDVTAQRIKTYIGSGKDFYIISTGVKYIVFSIKNMLKFVQNLDTQSLPSYLKELTDQVFQFAAIPQVEAFFGNIDLSKREVLIKLSPAQIHRFDTIFREEQKENLQAFLDIVYEFDVFASIAKAVENTIFAFLFSWIPVKPASISKVYFILLLKIR